MNQILTFVTKSPKRARADSGRALPSRDQVISGRGLARAEQSRDMSRPCSTTCAWKVSLNLGGSSSTRMYVLDWTLSKRLLASHW